VILKFMLLLLLLLLKESWCIYRQECGVFFWLIVFLAHQLSTLSLSSLLTFTAAYHVTSPINSFLWQDIVWNSPMFPGFPIKWYNPLILHTYSTLSFVNLHSFQKLLHMGILPARRTFGDNCARFLWGGCPTGNHVKALTPTTTGIHWLFPF